MLKLGTEVKDATLGACARCNYYILLPRALASIIAVGIAVGIGKGYLSFCDDSETSKVCGTFLLRLLLNELLALAT